MGTDEEYLENLGHFEVSGHAFKMLDTDKCVTSRHLYHMVSEMCIHQLAEQQCCC